MVRRGNDARSRLCTSGAVCHNAALMGHRLDSTSSASGAALSRFGYAYACPFAWRFS
jgi:hypothetical protein